MNNVTLIGRLTKDPEVRYTDKGNAVTKFTLAVDNSYKDGADFIRITVFGKQAESVGKYMAKGRQCAVQGSLQTGSYKNKSGDTVYTFDVIANRVEFLGGKSNEEPIPQGFNDMPNAFDAVDDDIPW